MGGCAHEIIKALILKRHGETVTQLAELITTTSIGDCAMFIDAESGDHSARDPNKPPWYPEPPSTTNSQGHLRPTSLPDIILFPKIKLNTTQPRRTQKRIILIDITFTDDIDVATRYQAKLDQHSAYCQHLKRHHWKPCIYPIVLTYSGCLTSSLRIFLKQDCGLTDHSINPFIRQLQTHTCKYNSKLIGTRAALKKKLTKLLPLPLPLSPPAPTLGLASTSTADPTAPPPPGSVSLPLLPSAPASLPPSTGVG